MAHTPVGHDNLGWCMADDCARVMPAQFVLAEHLRFACEHLTQKISAHAYLPCAADQGVTMKREISMSYFDTDEILSNILHAIAAVPFGLAFVVVVAAQFLAHAA
jgi:hypothetical protein